MKGSPFVRGTVFLTSATMISKMLGFIYVIPFTAMVGTSGYVLYTYAYRPYTIMLSIATMGLPLAVSKMVSKYDQLNDYHTVKRVLKSGVIFMILMGMISFLLLFMLAPHLAEIVIDGNDQTGNSISAVTYNIQIVSFALFIVPVMSLLRGFFQGFQSMGPSAASVVIEQIFRVLTILIGSFVVLHICKASISLAVGVSTFGAFMGAVAGLSVLSAYYMRRRKYLKKKEVTSVPKTTKSFFSLYKELFTYSIPFVVVSLAIPLYQTIDTFTINKLLIQVGYGQGEAEKINAIIGLVQMVVLIPVSVATAFSMSLVPEMTKAYTAGNTQRLYKHFTKTNVLVVGITFPAAIGMMVLAKPVYTFLFGAGNDPYMGSSILQYYAPACILFSLFTVTAAMLQGINQQQKTVLGLLIGVAVKVSLNIMLLPYLDYVSFIIATYAGYTISVLFNLWMLSKYVIKAT
ncbi:putative polysaccharide biosynthesis protein [Bacillus cytotoxicus]|uniref:Polysaccharide biosynthesis protein n=1 Tax=Bacillus cytotoxicus (strain DSM 22905 / CIP 110041 / 391-98 / NVH 391-98) TaxID=315749 RepID=A7GNZ3_BACCN|nr:polysaccharide biosynthesis protein [Bacillus cytotoxicus]ABS21851.1 polysaccharide biosynthesis protein [Bacillus cytotoxicus NVH 391-98]AWC44541.1 polysaccharide biosynthesis protein [Bacillus cytotoxicus]MDH2863213.1 polysaccharide biosynthesis protein [Bacillus cytotoxicus]MDH2882858.1 polysaccharide biosynthesis protein [Bacillus cytotoxicus]MDH2887149.1 polysaccharide biosynthesis protein [Bacillus cytotoxicus]